MEFLDHTLVWDWCREHGYALVEPEGPVAPRLADDASLTHCELVVHKAATDARAAAALATRVLEALGPWDECLAWATEWDVWSDIEDWPRYYAWRGRFGERRSLGAAPGHRFVEGEGAALGELLVHALECGWDLTLLPATAGRPTGRQVRTSHDEWVELQSREPVGFGRPVTFGPPAA